MKITMNQMLGVATIAAVLSAAPVSAGVLGGNLGGGLAGGLTGVGSAGGMGGIGGTLDRPMVIDRVGSTTGRAKDAAGSATDKAHGKVDGTRSAVQSKTDAVKDKAAEQPAATAPTSTTPAKGLDLGGGLGGEFDSPHAGANGNASGAAKASRTDGVSLDGQSTGAVRTGPKPAEPTTATTP